MKIHAQDFFESENLLSKPDERVEAAAQIGAVLLIASLIVLLWNGVSLGNAIFFALLIGFSPLVLQAVVSPRESSSNSQGPRELDGLLFPENASPVMNDGPGTFEYEVVGESYHQGGLRKIIAESGLSLEEPGEYFCQAFLLCEPGNPTDSNAIVVMIQNSRVGYIARNDAADLAPELRRLANTARQGSGGGVLCVQACIGWSVPDRIGVRLDLDVEAD